MSSNRNNQTRICTLGDGGVGKTSLVIQFISNHFVEYYDPTIEDSYRRQFLVDDQVHMLDILDTAGQDELTAMRDQWIRSCEGFILVYSVISRSSFDQIQIFKEQINRVLDTDNVPIMLVGNKADLDDQRQVSYQEGKDLSRCLGMSAFMETSSKNRTNVEEVFIETVRCIKRRNQALNNNNNSHKSSKDHQNSNKLSIFKKLNHKVQSSKSSFCKMM